MRQLEGDAVLPGRQSAAVQLHILCHSSAIAAIAWSQAGDGLLVSGADGVIAMYDIPDDEAEGDGSGEVRSAA